MDERTRGRATWALLALAVAVVAAIAIWPRAESASRSTGDAAVVTDGVGADAYGQGGGVGRRHATTAGVGRVQADVVDEDGAPVDGGTVVLRCLTADGDVRAIEGGTVALGDDGRLEGPACRGTVCAELRHAAFVNAEAWVLAPSETPVLRARTLAAVRGMVVDARGEPVVAAEIVASAEPGEDDPTAVLPVTTTVTSTDADGAFALPRIERSPCDPCREAEATCESSPLPVLDRILIRARAPGHAPGEVLVDVGGDEEAQIVLADAGEALSGRLSDAHGGAYPRAFVLARSIDRPAEQHRAEVDASDGSFAFASLGDGDYRVRAIQDGLEIAVHDAAASGETIALTGAATCDLEVQLVGDDAAPIARARVDGGPFANATSDAEGRVRASLVVAGTYMLRVKVEGDRASVHVLTVEGCDAGDEHRPASAGSPGSLPRIARIRLPISRKR